MCCAHSFSFVCLATLCTFVVGVSYWTTFINKMLYTRINSADIFTEWSLPFFIWCGWSTVEKSANFVYKSNAEFNHYITNGSEYIFSSNNSTRMSAIEGRKEKIQHKLSENLLFNNIYADLPFCRWHFSFNNIVCVVCRRCKRKYYMPSDRRKSFMDLLIEMLLSNANAHKLITVISIFIFFAYLLKCGICYLVIVYLTTIEEKVGSAIMNTPKIKKQSSK